MLYFFFKKDQNSCKEIARSFVSDLRNYTSDFERYCYSAQTLITTSQSRLKRLSVESGIKKIDFKGDKSNRPNEKKWDE